MDTRRDRVKHAGCANGSSNVVHPHYRRAKNKSMHCCRERRCVALIGWCPTKNCTKKPFARRANDDWCIDRSDDLIQSAEQRKIVF